MVDQIMTDLERKVKSNLENMKFQDNLLRKELDEYSADRTKLLEILYRLVRQTEISIKELKDLVADGKIFAGHSDVNPTSDLDRSVGPKIADSVFLRLRLDETVDEEPLTAVAKLEISNDVAKVKAEDLEPKSNPGNRAHPKEDLNLSLENINKISQLEENDSAIGKKLMDADYEIVDFNGLSVPLLPNKEEEQEVTTNLPLTRISRSRRLTRSIQHLTSDQSNQNPNNQQELTINETTKERASNDQLENDDKPSEQSETFPSKVLLSDSENNLPSELKSLPPTPILSTKELPTKTLLSQSESSGRVKDEEIAKCGFSRATNFFRDQERQSMRKTKPEDLVPRKTPAEIEKIKKRFGKPEIAEPK